LKTAFSARINFSKDSGLFSPRFCAVFFSAPVLAQLFTGLCRHCVSANGFRVPMTKMSFWAKALKVFSSVVRFVSVNVVDVFIRRKFRVPTCCHNTVHKPLPPKGKIALCVVCRSVGLHLAKNFSAPRNCVKVVKHTVFNAVHRKADHGRLLVSGLQDRRYI
jgi:hypothetical protein